MTITKEARAELRALLAKATPGPWHYRPYQFDNWGWVRSGPQGDDVPGDERGRGLIEYRDTRLYWDEPALAVHRKNGTDPFGNEAKLIAALLNRAEALLDELDRAETKALEQHDIVARIWVQLGSPTYEQLAGRSIYDMVDELKTRAETAEATIARLTAEVTEEEVDRVAVYKNDLWTGYDFVDPVPTLTAFIEGRKGGRVEGEETGNG